MIMPAMVALCLILMENGIIIIIRQAQLIIGETEMFPKLEERPNQKIEYLAKHPLFQSAE